MPIGSGGGGGGGGGTLQLFDSTLGADAATIDTGASGIAATANTLLVSILARTSEAVNPSSIKVTFNGDSGANYDVVTVQGVASAASSVPQAGIANINIQVPGTSDAAGTFAAWQLWIPGYRQTTAHKAVAAFGGWADSTAAQQTIQARAGRWRNTAAITQITLTANVNNILAGSRMTIYGLV